MTREIKLAVVLGFGLVLFVGILISDHFSVARRQDIANLLPASDPLARTNAPNVIDLNPIPPAIDGGLHASGLSNLPGETTAPAATPEVVIQQPDLQDLRTPPGPTTPAVTPPASAPGTTPGTAPGRIASSDRVHQVDALETLSKICVTYYGDRDLAPALARYNDIADPDRVREGRRLNIPDRARLTGATPAPSEAPSRPTSTNVPVYGTYTLVDGDTLSELAGRFLGSEGKWRELYELNRDRIEDPDHVPSGTTIKVPVKSRQRTSR